MDSQELFRKEAVLSATKNNSSVFHLKPIVSHSKAVFVLTFFFVVGIYFYVNRSFYIEKQDVTFGYIHSEKLADNDHLVPPNQFHAIFYFTHEKIEAIKDKKNIEANIFSNQHRTNYIVTLSEFEINNESLFPSEIDPKYLSSNNYVGPLQLVRAKAEVRRAANGTKIHLRNNLRIGISFL